MLDRSKLLKEVQQRSDALFVDYADQYTLARELWDTICKDSLLVYKLRAATTHYSIPQWDGAINAVISIDQNVTSYCAAAVDGSLVYPDRHQGVNCYLINIGAVAISYGVPDARVHFNSVPHLFTAEDDEEKVTPDTVNCRRDVFELSHGLTVSAQQRNADVPYALLFDGTLIFWHVESKDPAVKQAILQNYFTALMDLYNEKIPFASYISLPKNKELSNLLRLALCGYNTTECEQLSLLEHVNDASVAQFFLTPYTRTTVFKHTSALAELYPDPLKPYFFYLHVGNEIARVELPAWIARDETQVAMIASLILDQCIKGKGYPVVLAEAHEQAVIKGPDRDFFYHVIAKIGVDKKQRMKLSQKSLKKRGIGI